MELLKNVNLQYCGLTKQYKVAIKPPLIAREDERNIMQLDTHKIICLVSDKEAEERISNFFYDLDSSSIYELEYDIHTNVLRIDFNEKFSHVIFDYTFMKNHSEALKKVVFNSNMVCGYISHCENPDIFNFTNSKTTEFFTKVSPMSSDVVFNFLMLDFLGQLNTLHNQHNVKELINLKETI